jgi:predicted transcriptional regulator
MANPVRTLDMLCLPPGKKYNLSSLQPLHKKYRSHFEIIGLVLEAVKAEAATPFSIMKHANVNFMQLKKYLKSLTEIGFLEVEIKRSTISYRASKEGLEFLKQYYTLIEMLLTARI